MEFEDDDDLEEGREEEEEEDDDNDDDIEGITIPPQTLVSSATTAAAGERKASPAAGARYLNCQKNHAVGIGGHAVDGCGEFMPAAEDALKCAACSCHRNFHRKEITDTTPAAAYPQFPQPPPPPTYHRRMLALPSTSGGRGEDVDELSNPSSSGGGGSGRKKRFRTKFTAAQKEMMAAFADRVGWRIQKHDEAAVEQFCRDAQVTRQVLKVWMHNNKHTLGRKP